MMLGVNSSVNVGNIGGVMKVSADNNTFRARGKVAVFLSSAFSLTFSNPADGDQIFLIHSWSLQMAKCNFS